MGMIKLKSWNVVSRCRCQMKINKRSAMRGIPICVTIIICFLLFALSCTGAPPQTPPPVPSPPPETPSPEIVSATDYLKSVSFELYLAYINFGLDENVADYVLFVSSLPKDFGDYTLQNKLCIQDHELTELEKQFLEEPDQYLQQMFDGYMTEIVTVDPGLADKLKIIPFLKEIEITDVEALEDIIFLAGRAEYRVILEKIYGKGIERTMHPVALEKLVWDCYSSELDEPDLSIHSRLADFQAKYNAEMDADKVTEIKFDMRGMCYCDEPMGFQKNNEEYEFDVALMRWVLRCNTIRLWGHTDINRALAFVRLANDEGLDVYLTICPTAADAGISKDGYESCLVEYAENAQNLGVKYLSVGNEIELWWKEFGSSGAWGWTSASFENRKAGKVASYVDDLVKLARQYYSGCVTYNDYVAEGLGSLNWQNLDALSINIYGSYQLSKSYIQNMKQVAKSLNKPFYWTELGSLTITEAEQAGGDDSVIWESSVHLDQGKQAELIGQKLRLAYETKVDGIFVFVWDRSTWNNMNELGFGIWDSVKKEPKLSFWTVYKYYREE